jgi:hypothetical protein
MQADQELLQAAVEACCEDPQRRVYAPRVVIQALLSLMGKPPDRFVAMKSETSESTTWRVVWLAGNLLAYVEANKAEPSWDLTSQGQEDAQVQGWVRPVRDVTGVTVEEIHEGALGATWEWRAATTVQFRDGFTLSLPPFGGLPSSSSVAKLVDDFMAALRERMQSP